MRPWSRFQHLFHLVRMDFVPDGEADTEDERVVPREGVKQWPYIRSYVMKDGHLFLSLMAYVGIYEFEPTESSP